MVKHILGTLACDCFCCQSKSLAIEEGQKNTAKAMGRGMLKTGVFIPLVILVYLFTLETC